MFFSFVNLIFIFLRNQSTSLGCLFFGINLLVLLSHTLLLSAGSLIPSFIADGDCFGLYCASLKFLCWSHTLNVTIVGPRAYRCVIRALPSPMKAGPGSHRFGVLIGAEESLEMLLSAHAQRQGQDHAWWRGVAACRSGREGRWTPSLQAPWPQTSSIQN